MTEHFKGTEMEIRGLSVAYDGHVALESESADIRGNIIAVLGHNGAGKSTLIKSILNLLPLTSGTIRLRYVDDRGVTPLVPEEHMAFCPETGSVFADIPVESYLKLWCRIKHGDAKYYRRGGSHYMELLSLEPLLPKLGRELSKGQRRRVQ